MFKGLRFFIREGWKYDKKYVIWLVLSQLLNSLIPVAAALLPKLVIDELTGAQRVNRLVMYVAILAGYLLIANVLTSYFTKDSFSHRCRVDAAFHNELHRRLTLADYANLESPAFQDMKAKAQKFLTCDFHGFGYLLDCAVNILGRLVTVIGLIAILSTMEIWFILLFMVLAVIASTIESSAQKKAMSVSMQIVQNQRHWMYYIDLFENVRWAKELRLNGISEWTLGKERTYSGKANDGIKMQNDLFIASGVKRAGLTFVQQCVAYGILIAKVISGSVSIGSFTMCVSAVTSFAEAMRQILDSVNEIRAYDMYYDKLDEYLNVPAKLREGKRLPVADGEHRFEFRNVGFRYAGSEVWALRNVNITIESGQKLSLVGENGSGKSTFIKLLCRLYDPTEGTILMDGVDIRDMDYEQYLARFSTVFQDFSLFDFSLRENLAFDGRVNDERIMEVIRQVGLEQRVSTLPNGLDTNVGRTFDEQGFEPSGGEAQKIALARALIKDAPVVILDEPTAAMDARAEYELYRSFNDLTLGKTAIYISHRMSSSRFCDKVAVLENGRLSEYGTHDELMALGGQYAELYAMQAQYYID